MKNISDHSVEINEEEYTITPVPAVKGLSLMRRLTKIVGPSMASFFSGNEQSEEIEQESLQKAIDLLVDKMGNDDVEKLILDLMSSVTKNGQPLNFNMEFTADYGKLFKLLTEVIKVNFGGLFLQSGISL